MSDEPESPGPGSFRRRWLPLWALIGAVLSVVLLLQTPPGGSALRALGLAAEPRPFTELSFVSPRELPVQVAAGKAPPNAEFEIRNRTGAQQHYRWAAFAVRGKTRVPLGTGDVVLADGERATVEPPAVRCTPGPIRYLVELEDRRESLAFHAECEVP